MTTPLDLEELKRLVAEMSERISPEMAKHDVAVKLVLASVDIMSELIARVERAEKALAFIRDENWAWATRETPSEAPRRVYGRWSEVARTVVPEPAHTGDTPNVEAPAAGDYTLTCGDLRKAAAVLTKLKSGDRP